MKTPLVAVLLLSAGCGAANYPSDLDPLTIDVREHDRVAGSFERDGVGLRFDFSRSGPRHVLAFRAGDGRALVTTTLDGSRQTTDVFDGRLVISGIPNQPNPTIVGDERAMEELQARPEAELLEALGEALAAADIDTALLQPTPEPAAAPSSRTETSGAGLRYETWSTGHFYLGPNQSMTFLSAAGAWPTYIYLRKYTDNPGQISIWYSPLSGASGGFIHNSNFGTTAYVTKYWWGAAFNVTCISTVYNACRVRVSPYTWSEF